MKINKEIERANRMIKRGKCLIAYYIIRNLINEITSENKPTDRLLNIVALLENKKQLVLSMVR
jgi:hypothetical protein